MTDPLAPWEPSAGDPFDLRKVGHLLRRAGFGGSLRTRRELQAAGVDAAVAAVAGRDDAPSPPDARLEDALAFGDLGRVRAFSVLRALEGQRPLRERMSVFWHGHFATSNRKVQDPRAMAVQMATFDRLGLGPFGELCAEMCRDPALLVWLDNDKSRRERPNENLARELFELFTLGRGNYGEDDVRTAARALTGYQVHGGAFCFVAALHDGGDKELFGARGPLRGEDVARLAARQPAACRFLAGRLLRHFVHPEPEPAETEALAAHLRRSGGDVGDALRTLLRSRLFFSGRAYRSLVKSPADFVLGLVRGLGARAAPTDLAAAMARLGEAWLEPPTVEGWPGGRAWLTGTTWLLRSNVAADLLGGRRGRLRPGAGTLLGGVAPQHRAELALQLLLDGDVSADSRGRLLAFAAAGPAEGGEAALLHAVTALPEYQLL